MTRLAWTLPGPRPAVFPEKSPARMRNRSRVPAATPRSTGSVITPHPHVQFELFYHTPTRRCTLERPLSSCRDRLGNLRDNGIEALPGVYPHRSGGGRRRLLCGEFCALVPRSARDRSVDRLCRLVRGRHRNRRVDRDPMVRRTRGSLEAVVFGADRPGCRRAPPLGARLVTVQSASTAAQPRNAGSGWVTTYVGVAAR